MHRKAFPQHEPEVLAANAAANCRDNVVRGVELVSRSGGYEELAQMDRTVRVLPDSLVQDVRSLMCAEGFYIVQVSNCPRTIAIEIGACLQKASGAQNGFLIEGADLGLMEIGPMWPDLDEMSRSR